MCACVCVYVTLPVPLKMLLDSELFMLKPGFLFTPNPDILTHTHTHTIEC